MGEARFAGVGQGEVGHGGVGWCGWGVVLPSMTASTDEEYMVWGWAGWDPGTHPAHPIQATTYSHRFFLVVTLTNSPSVRYCIHSKLQRLMLLSTHPQASQQSRHAVPSPNHTDNG